MKVIGVEGLEAIHGRLGLVSATVRDAELVMAQLADGARVAVGQRACKVVVRAQAQIAQMLPLVRRVMAQTRARVLGGDKHYRDKVFSLFEPHTDEHLTKRDYFVNLPHPL